jgi:hypothetical protein
LLTASTYNGLFQKPVWVEKIQEKERDEEENKEDEIEDSLIYKWSPSKAGGMFDSSLTILLIKFDNARKGIF